MQAWENPCNRQMVLCGYAQHMALTTSQLLTSQVECPGLCRRGPFGTCANLLGQDV